MKVEAFTPKGRAILDLDNADDIKTFGGQEAVDYYMEMQRDLKQEKIEALEARIAELEGN